MAKIYNRKELVKSLSVTGKEERKIENGAASRLLERV